MGKPAPENTLEFRPSGQYRHDISMGNIESLEYDSVENTLTITQSTEPPRPIEDDLKNENGQIVVSSRMVAERFGKEHKHVLRDIDNLIKEGGVQNWTTLFVLTQYHHPQNKQWYPEYLMTRDGFTLLAMGFTGKEALQFKLAYIEAFNKMEEALKNQTPALPTTYKDALIALVAEVEAKEQLQLEVKAKEEVIQEMKPKSEYCERILKSKGTVTITVIAKDYGMSAKAMNQLLKDKGIQWKVDGTWVLRQEHAGKGYTSSYTGTNESRFGEEYSFVGTNWTQKDRMFML